MVNTLYILDHVALAVAPDTKELVAAYKKKVNIVDSLIKPHLIVRLNATHAGFVNSNKMYYIPDKMRKSIDTWTNPYPKPVLTHHDRKSDPIGRIMQAVYLDQEPDGESNSPIGYTQLLTKISDSDAIEKISDGRLNTVSVGGSSMEAWCSICNQDLARDGICAHTKGKPYPLNQDDDTGDLQECYWKVGLIQYKEVSFINCPADEFAGVVNMELNTSETDKRVSNLDFLVESGNRQIILKDFIEENISIDDTEGNNMAVTDEKKNTATPDTSPADGEGVTEDKDTNAATSGESVQASDDKTDTSDSDANADTSDVAIEFSEEETAELEVLDKQFTAEINDLAKVLPEFADAKLSTSKRKSLPGSTFCGPNRSFPVPDCAHVTAARRLIGRAKVSSSTKSKILACVSRKAKSMDCGSSSSSKDSFDLRPAFDVVSDQLATTKEELKITYATIDNLKKEIVDLQAGQERLLAENEELRKGTHQDKAEEVLRLKLELKKPDVKHILEAEHNDATKLKESKLVELSKRSTQSLDDSLADLRMEFEEAKKFNSNVLPEVTNPGVVGDDKNDHSDTGDTVPDLERMPHKDRMEWFMYKDNKKK